MDRVFHHDDSMYVAANKVYTKDDGVAYSDAECKVSINAETLEKLFLEGMVVVVDGASYRPVSCKVASNIATVTYVTADSSAATTAKLATVKSK